VPFNCRCVLTGNLERCLALPALGSGVPLDPSAGALRMWLHACHLTSVGYLLSTV